MFRTAMQVGEVAAPAAGDQDLLADLFSALQHGHAPSALAGFNGAHQARRAAAQNDYVKLRSHEEGLATQSKRREHDQAERHQDVQDQQRQQPAAQTLFAVGSHVVEGLQVRFELKNVAFELINVRGQQL